MKQLWIACLLVAACKQVGNDKGATGKVAPAVTSPTSATAGSAAPGVAGSNAPGSAAAAAASTAGWQACTTEKDCALIEVGCCDHCNGGKLLSVAQAHKDEALAKYKQTGCSGQCTERGCDGEPTPICKAGVCGYRTNGQSSRDVVEPLP